MALDEGRVGAAGQHIRIGEQAWSTAMLVSTPSMRNSLRARAQRAAASGQPPSGAWAMTLARRES